MAERGRGRQKSREVMKRSYLEYAINMAAAISLYSRRKAAAAPFVEKILKLNGF